MVSCNFKLILFRSPMTSSYYSNGELPSIKRRRKTNREMADNRSHGRSSNVLDVAVEVVYRKACIIRVPNAKEQRA